MKDAVICPPQIFLGCIIWGGGGWWLGKSPRLSPVGVKCFSSISINVYLGPLKKGECLRSTVAQW